MGRLFLIYLRQAMTQDVLGELFGMAHTCRQQMDTPTFTDIKSDFGRPWGVAIPGNSRFTF